MRLRFLKLIPLISLPLFVTSGLFIFIQTVSHAEPASHLVISEVQTAGVTADDEFIELYNPTDHEISLDGWSIQYQSAQGSAYAKKNFESEAVVAPHGFFLIARGDGYVQNTTSPADMLHKSFSLSGDGGTVYIMATTALVPSATATQIIDRLAWGTAGSETTPAPTPAPKQSIERKAYATSTTEMLINGLHRAMGNAWDTDNDAQDFIVRTIPEPQNTTSLPEPEIMQQIPQTENINHTDFTDDELDDLITDILDELESSSTDIIISEVYPNPPNEADEFIELQNRGNFSVNMSGWIVKDLTKSYTLKEADFMAQTLTVPPLGFLILPRSITGIALNNTGSETIVLETPEGAATAQITYSSSAPENQTYAWDSTQWQWTTTSTPGAANVITSPPPPTAGKSFSPPIGGSSSSASPQMTTGPTTIRITELLPNPNGDDADHEFIELFNYGNAPILLAGWILADTATHYTITPDTYDDFTMMPGEYFAFYRLLTNIALNNTGGDSVTVSNQSGTVIDSVNYAESAAENESYIRIASNAWQWSATPTPGLANQITAKKTSSASSSSSGTPTNTQTATPNSPIPADTSPSHSLMMDPFRQIYFSELLPNPDGSDTDLEWIELFNPNTTTVDIGGWTLSDIGSSDKPYRFPITVHLAGLSFLVIDRDESNIALNNTGSETVTLIDDENRTVHSVTYNSPPEDTSYAYIIDAGWEWTNVLTPSATNERQRQTTPHAAKNDSGDLNVGGGDELIDMLAATSNNSNYPYELEISEIRDLPPNAEVQTTGIVTISSAALGKTIRYIESPDRTGGIQIYQSRGDFGDFEIGDHITVTGILSNNQGEARIKIASSEAINLLDSGNSVLPESRATGDISEDDEGRLVTITGTVTNRSGQNIYLDDGSGVMRAYLRKEIGITLPKITKGETTLEITGIISQTAAGYRILPRDQADVIVVGSIDQPPNDNTPILNEINLKDSMPQAKNAAIPLERITIPPNDPPASTAFQYLAITTFMVLGAIIILYLKHVWWFQRKEKILWNAWPNSLSSLPPQKTLQ